MKLEPYLTLGGVELANSLRTLSYLRVLNHPARASLQHPLPYYEGPGYSDIYSDIYDGDPFVVANLACYCAVIDGGPYARPSYDPAPWYDPDRPESNDFLGLRLDLELVPVAKRPVTSLVKGGASLGAVAYGVRVLQASGEAYAMSRAGMEYGERWLARALAGGTGCEDDVAVILPSCPPDGVDDPDGYLRELAGIGVVDGPVFSIIDVELPECEIEAVSFQLAAGDPWLRRRSAVVTTPLEAGDVWSEVITAPPAADTALVITINGGSSADGSIIVATGAATASYTVDGLVHTLVLDSSRRTASDGDGGGFGALSFSGPPTWLIAPAGESMRVSVRAGGSPIVLTVERVDLEL